MEKELEQITQGIAQDILGKMEYRGFYDCGKYLDDDIIQGLMPSLVLAYQAGIRRAHTMARERYEEVVGPIKLRMEYGDPLHQIKKLKTPEWFGRQNELGCLLTALDAELHGKH